MIYSLFNFYLLPKCSIINPQTMNIKISNHIYIISKLYKQNITLLNFSLYNYHMILKTKNNLK